jgi:hypothetical protein
VTQVVVLAAAVGMVLLLDTLSPTSVQAFQITKGYQQSRTAVWTGKQEKQRTDQNILVIGKLQSIAVPSNRQLMALKKSQNDEPSIDSRSLPSKSTPPPTTTTSTMTRRKMVTTTTSTMSPPTSSPLPPVLQEITDERMEFRIKLGRAMDTLRRDMSDILTKSPGKSYSKTMI